MIFFLRGPASTPTVLAPRATTPTGVIAHKQLGFLIPNCLKLEDATNILCDSLTIFTPLIRNGASPGKKFGVIGISGLVSTSPFLSSFLPPLFIYPSPSRLDASILHLTIDFMSVDN
jgi:hypothetical protein